jgi:hypothetical protein
MAKEFSLSSGQSPDQNLMKIPVFWLIAPMMETHLTRSSTSTRHYRATSAKTRRRKNLKSLNETMSL